MKYKKRAIWFALALAVLTLPAFSGGFWLELGNPQANAEARALNAVLTFRPTGCANPIDAKVSAAAVGMVRGKLETVPLHVKALSTPGLYAIVREWPAEGRWLLRITANYGASVTSSLVPVNAEGADRTAAKFLNRQPADKDVTALLAGN